jgi:hypothetical protein
MTKVEKEQPEKKLKVHQNSTGRKELADIGEIVAMNLS